MSETKTKYAYVGFIGYNENDIKNLVAYTCAGDCLAPDIQDGDIVIINTVLKPRFNDFVFVRHSSGEVHLAKYTARYVPGPLYLVNEHDSWPVADGDSLFPVVGIKRRIKGEGN